MTMGRWRARGQEHVTRVLSDALRQGRLAHALLLVGPPHVGKMTLAMDLARAVNCLGQDPPCGTCAQCQRVERGLHADVQVIGPRGEEEGRRTRWEISIEQVRALEHTAALKPYEGRCRVFILDGVERLSAAAANALLKTLEEPPEQVLLVLLAAREERLPPTLPSRCQRLELRPLPVREVEAAMLREYGLAPDRARLVARLSRGLFGWAMAASTDPNVLEQRDEDLRRLHRVVAGGLEERFQCAQELATRFGRERDKVLETLGLWLSWWRDVLMVQERAPELVVHWDQRGELGRQARRWTAEEARQGLRELVLTLERLEHNANPRMALDVLMLALPPPALARTP
ncbi:MAG: DNA polymerase III subunit [Chloroflexi bacterium]|nr:DNA polymerase III subunit [Chloroflexota bacterium]